MLSGQKKLKICRESISGGSQPGVIQGGEEAVVAPGEVGRVEVQPVSFDRLVEDKSETGCASHQCAHHGHTLNKFKV